MTHNVIIGGFGSDRQSVGNMARELTIHYDEEFIPISFCDADNDPRELARLTKGTTVYTHSGGVITLKDTKPREIVAIAPPLPRPSAGLVVSAAFSTGELIGSSFESSGRFRRVGACSLFMAKEMMLHGSRHARCIGRIAAFNALDAGQAATQAGVDVTMGFMEGDWIFPSSEQIIQSAARRGIHAVRLTGEHERFAIEPVATMREFNEKIAKNNHLATKVANV